MIRAGEIFFAYGSIIYNIFSILICTFFYLIEMYIGFTPAFLMIILSKILYMQLQEANQHVILSQSLISSFMNDMIPFIH